MRLIAALLLAILVLTCAARLRPPEYDEAYSIFLTAGDARPAWPPGIFHPGDVRDFYQGKPGLQKIAAALRAGDVHPPLYFWALEYWRRLTGPGWFAARMLSVLFSIAALTALAWLAALAEIPPAATLLIVLLSYGFAYTGIVARGFGCAQLLNILGMALIYKGAKDRKWIFCLAGGVAFGAAGFSNYLAIFIGLASLFWLLCSRSSRKLAVPAAIGLLLWLPPIAYFFSAQRNSRIGQFVAFSPIHAIFLLLKDGAAAWFGGLPVYAGPAGRLVAAGIAVLIAICAGWVVKNWQPKLLPFALAAIATPAGLLALGLIFDNTPIEIRYLAFGMPFIALALAQTLPRKLLYLVLCIEACGVAGLAFAPATMQPQGIAARQCRAFATPASLVLLARGNDGVGVPGPFIAMAPDDLRLELVRPGIAPDLAAERHVILVTIGPDAASRQATAETSRELSENSCWLAKTSTDFLKVYTRTCTDH